MNTEVLIDEVNSHCFQFEEAGEKKLGTWGRGMRLNKETRTIDVLFAAQ